MNSDQPPSPSFQITIDKNMQNGVGLAFGFAGAEDIVQTADQLISIHAYL
jgi:hypothetical protein